MRIARQRFGNTELQVSSLGLGTAEIGFSQSSDDALESILRVASEADINVLDTAAMYGDAEERLGRLLLGRRDQFLVFTKCGRHLPRLNSLGRSLRKVRRIAGSGGRALL